MEHELGAASESSESSESSEAWGGSGAELPPPTEDVHAMYARLGFIIVSGKMSAAQTKGEYKKKFAFPRGWQTTESREYEKNTSGFALVTGARSGITAIDIDDPDTPNNARLMRLMADCTLVARTKKGFHYVFKYDPRILQTAGDKLDTRNDGGCIFVAPSVAYDDTGRTVAEYSWVRVPDADAGLIAVPEPVIDFLRALDRRYVRSGTPYPAASAAVPAVPASAAVPALTMPMAPETPTAPTAPTNVNAPATPSVPTAQTAHTAHPHDDALMAHALRAVEARAGLHRDTTRVGFPLRVVPLDKPDVWGRPAVRIDFSHRSGSARVCPVSRILHESNHFFVTLGVDDERTGLPAFFLYCHDTNECNPRKEHKMLAFVNPDSYPALGIDPNTRPDVPTTMSFGQAVVLLGKMQEHVDRLIENPGGAWDTVINLGYIACALCTAASKHEPTLAVAKEMLEKLLDVSAMTRAEKEHASSAFQHAKLALETSDPLMTIRGYAAGLSGKREHELMAVCEAITACTDPALEANVRKAAEHMLKVLDDCERRQLSSNFTDLGMFFYFIWRRVARFACDSSQRTEDKQYTFFLFDGATYKHGKRRQFASKVKEHVRLVVTALEAIPLLKSRAESLEAKCTSSDIVSKAISETLIESLTDDDKLAACGLCTTEKFDRDLDAGDYIGFTNGVFDVATLTFLPKGEVPFNVLACKTTRYAYVPPDDPRCAAKLAEINEFLRTLHAVDYNDPNDANLATMRMLSGSFLTRGNPYKKVIVFLGAAGDNGKSTYTKLIQLSLGDYAVTGNKRSLSGTVDQDTLDPDLVANYKSLLCVFPEVQSNEAGLSCGFKFNGGKLKALTGDDEQNGRALYCDARCYDIGFVPLVHTNLVPLVDSNDATATSRLWIAPFDSKFPAGLTVADPARRIYPRIDKLKERLREWAPYHFLICALAP